MPFDPSWFCALLASTLSGQVFTLPLSQPLELYLLSGDEFCTRQVQDSSPPELCGLSSLTF